MTSERKKYLKKKKKQEQKRKQKRYKRAIEKTNRKKFIIKQYQNYFIKSS